MFGALLAPAGPSLLTTTFPGKKERGTAFGVYGGIVGSGAAVGPLLGGALTYLLGPLLLSGTGMGLVVSPSMNTAPSPAGGPAPG
jgi:MFS family permease